MDKKILEFLKCFKINEHEIKDIMNISPMLEYASYEDFFCNCNLLVDYGYPKEDLDFLIMANPNIFVMTKEDLVEELIELSKKYDDIEEILKKDPNII